MDYNRDNRLLLFTSKKVIILFSKIPANLSEKGNQLYANSLFLQSSFPGQKITDCSALK
jgi:hypothetical protein